MLNKTGFTTTLLVALIAGGFPSLMAQVSKPTAEDLGQRGMGGPPGAGVQAQRGGAMAVVMIPPSVDPRDISGTWSEMNPDRSGGGGRGGPAGGGAPGGARGGGPGGGGAGGPPGGGAPAGAGGGGPPGSGANSKLQCFPSFSSFGGVEGVVDIMQSDRVTILVGQEMQLVRRIYMTNEHPRNVQATFFGDSIGHWDGDTLVVDTIGIRGNGNNTRHVVERIRKINNGQNLESVQTEINASGTASANGRTSSIYWNPGRKFNEWICEDADEFWDPNYR